MLAAVGCLLALVCANLANFFAARNLGRQRELALRVGLGASAGRIARLLFAESLLVAGVGGLVAQLVAVTAQPLLAGVVPQDVDRLGGPPGLDLRAIAFASLLSLLTGLAFGSFAAWRAGTQDPTVLLRQARGTSAARAGARAVVVGIDRQRMRPRSVFARRLPALVGGYRGGSWAPVALSTGLLVLVALAASLVPFLRVLRRATVTLLRAD